MVLVALTGCPSNPPATPASTARNLPIIQHTVGDVTPLEAEDSKFENSIGMTLVRIEPGTFTAGWPDEDNPEYREFGGPQHEVTITRPYYVSVHEVTQSQYEQVMGVNPSRHSPNSTTPEFAQEYAGTDTSDYPVEQVNHADALEFCRKLSELEDEKAAGRVYTLPTEAQWEYACRAGSEDFFHTGQTLKTGMANFDTRYPYPADAEKGEHLGQPTSVGSYPPNDWGIYDMHGNVQEWTLDAARIYTPEAVTDPTADGSVSEYRVLRGGSFRRNANYQRSSGRNPYPMASKLYDIGFRVIIQQ